MVQASVTFLCRSLDPGGSERQLLLLADGLIKRGVTVNIITFYPLLSKVFDIPEGLTVTCLNKRGRWHVLSFFRDLYRETKNCTLIHSYLTVPNILTVLLKLISPRLKVIWGMRASDMIWQDWLSRLTAKAEQKLSSFADGIIVNSWAGEAYMRKKGYRNHCIECIPNGVDTKRFYPRRERSLRQAWGIQDKEILIGHVGRLDPMKDHETFLRAAQLVLQTLPNARFVCVGDGPQDYKDKLRVRAHELNLTPFLQWHPAFPNIETLYPCLDLLCSSSAFGEGSSNVLLEALACNTPCVATDVGDNRRILGSHGLIVLPRDPQSLARAMITCLQTSSDADSSSYIAQQFSKEVLAERTLAILQKWKVL